MIQFLIILSPFLWALENAKVLPKSVRKVQVINIYSQFSGKTDSSGKTQSLASPLQKDLTFSDFINSRAGLQKTQLEGFLIANGVSEDTKVGELTADFSGSVNAVVPTFAYGITNRLTVGFAIPYLVTQSDVEVGFKTNENADAFIAQLADPTTGQRTNLQTALTSINGVTNTLNDRLKEYGYEDLGYYRQEGLGDVVVKAKYQSINGSVVRLANTAGLNLPTGKPDDPDVLTDIPTGDGQTDVYTGVFLDEQVTSGLYFNQYVRYTAQLASERRMRKITAEESVVSEKEKVTYDLGDKVEAGASVNHSLDLGITSALGYNYYYKAKDQYSNSLYEKDTEQTAQNGEFALGYSTIDAYRRGEVDAPLMATFTYQRHLFSKNTVVGDRFQFDFQLFF